MLQTSLPIRYEDYSISDTKCGILAEKKCMIVIDSMYDHICPIQVCKEQGGEEWYRHHRVRITASKSLNQSNVGCHLYSICVNHLFYADDSGYCTLTCGS